MPRDLSMVEMDYLFLDASHFKMHDGQRAGPILPLRHHHRRRTGLRRPGRRRSGVHRHRAQLPVRPGPVVAFARSCSSSPTARQP